MGRSTRVRRPRLRRLARLSSRRARHAQEPLRRMADLPSPRSPRYRSLDFWRGVACLLVVVFHASYDVRVADEPQPFRAIFRAVSYLWLGVPMFFVISGYCI